MQHANLICYAWINIPLAYTQVSNHLPFSFCIKPDDDI